MQNFNYHTHTVRCGHATGKDDEYIQSAIHAGFKVLGISEHIGFEGWDDKNERIAFKDLNQYIKDMQALKEIYNDKIDIKIGFEFEYFSDKETYLKEMLSKVDYMIVGQHAKSFDQYYDRTCNDDDVDMYASQICAALDHKLTKYVAHLDYFLLGKETFSKRNEIAIENICDAVLRNDAYVEMNLKGTTYGKKMYHDKLQYIYPHYDVFRIVASKGCKVVFGYDAHSPQMLEVRNKEELLKEEFKDLHLNFQDTIEL